MLYVLFFWIPYSQSVIETCVILAFFLWIIKRVFVFKDFLRQGELKVGVAWQRAFSPAASFLNVPIAFFIVVCIFSISGSLFPAKSAYGFLTKTLEWFVVYFLILEVFTERRHVLNFFIVFMFSSSAVILDSLIQFYLTHKDIFRGYPLTARGATACFHHPNQLAGFLIFLSSLSFSFLFRQKASPRSRLFYSVFFTLAIWSLSITFSRGGWLANIVGILLCCYLVNKKFFKKFLLGGLLLISLLYLALPLDTKRDFRIDPAYVGQTASWRLGVWADSLRMIKEAPFFGHGPNTYMDLFQYYRRNSANMADLGPTYAHNCYIHLAAEMGMLGLAGFLWMMARLFTNVIRKWNAAIHTAQKEDLFYLYLLVGLLSGVAGLLVQSFFDTHLYSLRFYVLFWSAIGLCVSIDRLIVLDKVPGK